MVSIPIQPTWLFARRGDGSCLVTFDEQNGGELDLARVFIEALVRAAPFGMLLERHRDRVAASAVLVLTYSPTDPLGDHLQVRARRVDRLESLGCVRHLDPRRTAWRYTLWGAIRFAVRAILQGVRRVVVPDSLLTQFRPHRSAEQSFRTR